MKDRLLSILLALCMVLTLLPAQAMAEEMDSDGMEALSVEVENEESEVPEEVKQGGESADELYTEPEVSEELSISEEAEEEAEEDMEVSIEADSETMELAAVPDSGTCGDNLTWTLNADGVLTISGTGAMADYTNYRDDYTPWYNQSTAITAVVIENGVTSIGDYAFFECSGLMSIDIGNNVSSIGNYAFGDCIGLTSIAIPNSVTSIGNEAFYNCSGLTSMVIPDSVASIGESAFINCSGLTSVTLPSNLTIIKAGTFEDCNGLTNIVIPNSVTNIGEGAFQRCSELKSITLPSSLTITEGWVFAGCTGLTSITLPDGLTSISYRVFSGCSNLKSITLPDSLTSIGFRSFMGCNKLTSVILPNSLTRIEEGMFEDCNGLTNIVIPNSVISIESDAFKNCSGLTNVTLPSSVTSIGNSAFSNCNGLTSVTLPSSLMQIGASTFKDCSSLTSIVIPNSVTLVGVRAFSGCNALADVYYAGTVSQWENISIYSDNDPLTDATIHCSDGDIKGSETNPSGTASITQLYPTNSSTFDHASASTDKHFHITFDHEVTNAGGNRPSLDFSVGTLRVHKASDDSVIYEVAESSFTAGTSTNVSLWGSSAPFTAISIDGITPKLDYGTDYYVTMPAGFVKFEDGTVSPAIVKGDWKFTTINAYEPAKNVAMPFKNGFGEEAKNIDVKWDDAWFGNDPTTYIHELAITSMALSGTSYIETNGLPSSKFLNEALSKLNFTNIESYNYFDVDTNNQHYEKLSKDDNDHVGYTFATKEIGRNPSKPEHLIAIVIKGTSGNEEWYSNFNIGKDGTEHAGFQLAKEELLKDFHNYLSSSNLEGGAVKFLVTGHSRGAGVANWIAANLTDDYGKQKVYAYTFAAPAVSTHATETGYENIFNIISGEDFVTQVPLSKWNYERYGIDLLLPSRSYYGSQYSIVYQKMSNKFEYMTGETHESFNGTYAVDSLKSTIYELAPHVNELYTKKYDLVGTFLIKTTTTIEYFNMLADVIVEGGLGNAAQMLASYNQGDFADITHFFIQNHIFSPRVFSAHSMAGYYSWLSSCSARELFGSSNSSTYKRFKRIRVACPVNVYVYSKDGTLLSSVVNEQIIGDILSVNVEDEIKVIDLPDDQEYFIKIIATGEGRVSYTIEELSAEAVGDTVLRVVNFNDIKINQNDELSATVNNTIYTDNRNYALTKNGTETIYADYDSYAPNTPGSGSVGGGDSSSTGSGNSPSNSGTSGSGSSGHSGGYSGSTSSALRNKKSSSSTGSTTVTTPSTPSGIFSDVPSNHTFASAIAWARDNGIMSGYSDGTFRPDNSTNRQQMWMVLARMSGTYPANMTEARTWAINSGISDGTNPESPLSRQQLIAMLYRFAQMQGMEITGTADISGYPDNSLAADYAKEAMAWAVDNGIILGTTDGRLNPEGPANRAQFAAILYRFYNGIADA